ncbi:hypothetical protein GW932_04535 [archaeon]|nr:hypothetical protein [archaeon]
MKTPYLKFHKEKLINNYNTFQKVCEEHFNKNFQICFSTKTNTNPLTIETLKKLNSGFEVASLRELKLTPKKNFRVLNGPAKTHEELNEAIKNNVLIFIDSFSEFNKIQSVNPNNSGVQLGIRLGNKNSKFGFSSSQFKEAFEKINPIGIQLHQGTLNKFNEFQKNLKEQKKLISPYLKKIKYLDFGGGFPDNFQLKNLGLTLTDYIKEIKETFKDFRGIFIFEPGRNLVSDTYTLITKVITIKEKDETTYAILDAGINILSKMTLANFKFNKITSQKKETITTKKVSAQLGREGRVSAIWDVDNKVQTYTLAGPLLFGNDILGKWHGKISEGDFFEVENVGAYCENLSWEIIYEKVKVL